MYSTEESAYFVNKEGTIKEKMSRGLNNLTTVTQKIYGIIKTVFEFMFL